MTNTPVDTDSDASIAEKQQRLETIIEQLDDGAISLDQAKNLHEEGTALITALENELTLGEGGCHRTAVRSVCITQRKPAQNIPGMPSSDVTAATIASTPSANKPLLATLLS